jgi:hypothetical protein
MLDWLLVARTRASYLRFMRQINMRVCTLRPTSSGGAAVLRACGRALGAARRARAGIVADGRPGLAHRQRQRAAQGAPAPALRTPKGAAALASCQLPL